MSDRRWLALILVMALAVSATACGTEAAPASGGDPETVVQSFYDWYLDAAGFDPESQERRNPLVEGTYRERPELSAEFVARLDASVAEGLAADPLLCAQDVPEAVETGETAITDDGATVAVTTSFAGHGFTVALRQAAEGWQIDDVTCQAP